MGLYAGAADGRTHELSGATRGAILLSQGLVSLAAVYSTYRLAVSPDGIESMNWCVFLGGRYVVSIWLGLQWFSASQRVSVSLVLPSEEEGGLTLF